MLPQLLFGVVLAAIIAAAAFYARALNFSGAIAAFVLGTVIFGIGGLNWAILLMAFFIPSSLLSFLFKKQKGALEANFAKGSRRDAGQVAANGAIAGLCALLFPFLGQPGWLWVACAGALAAASADTWSTEIGILGKGRPRMITTGKPVDSGTSGGVSLLGFAAAAAGSALLAVFAIILKPDAIANSLSNNLFIFIIVLFAGLGGSIVDSILGAVGQAMYYCDVCHKETEKSPVHTCGAPTRHIRGKLWMDNDRVNAFCTFSGALLAGVLSAFMLSSPFPVIDQGGARMSKITLSSPAFANGQSIPQKFSCDGQNLSPALQWSDIPAGTLSLALIMNDPDAPMGTYTHWVVYNLPQESTGLPEGVPSGELSDGAVQGKNSSNTNEYFGPCPPAGKPHHYFFRLYALDINPELPLSLTAEQVSSRLNGHILAVGEWMGTYGR